MKYGLIGERLGHSFSKSIHRQLGYEYELREIAKGELGDFMLKRNFLGINVTIPYKEAVIPYLDEIDESAREIGAVNTVVNRDGRLYGYNTDFFGMRRLFDHAGVDACGKKAVILGSGGTSKTARAVLSALGAREIIRVSRVGKDGAISYEELYKSHTDAEIMVNTTPLGMYPSIDSCPVDLSNFDRLTGVIDAVYNPIKTTLVQEAKGRCVAAEGGLYMLTAQAVRASEHFLGKSYADGVIDEIYRDILRQNEGIVLIGMPASGKSTVGRMLSERLGKEFIDTDELIVGRIKMSIGEYFSRYGEAEFRKREAEVIDELSPNGSYVIATGGGAVLNKNNLKRLRHLGRLYFIDRPLESLMPTSDRPLSSDREAMRQRYTERYPIYLGECDERIDADCDTLSVAEKILERY